MDKIFIAFVLVNFVHLILGKLCNDTLVWTGFTKKHGSIGVICDLDLITSNVSSESLKKQYNSTSELYGGIVYDARTSLVAVSEFSKKTLKMFNLSDPIQGELIKWTYTFEFAPISVVTGVALATNFNLLYWVDAVFQCIGVVNFMTSNWTKIIDSDLELPIFIAIHEEKKLVFWSDIGSSQKIERSNLYGEGRTTIVDSFSSKHQGLVLDKNTDRLFWVDSSLKSCDLEGGDFIDYGTLVDESFHSFVVDRDMVLFFKLGGYFEYFEISENNLLVNKSKTHFANTTFVGSSFFDSKEFITNLANPCIKNPCDHLCFPKNEKKYICRCSIGYTLGNDGVTCNKAGLTSSSLKTGQILVRDYTGIIYQLDPSNGEASTVLRIQPNKLTNITYLKCSNGTFIYYTNEDERTIMRYNASSRNSSVYHILTSHSITDMVADQATGELYVSNNFGQILKISFEGKVFQVIHFDAKGEEEIRKLYIHQKTRRMFYSDCDSLTVKEIEIETGFNLNETYETNFCVNSMAFDFDSEYAYYAENKNIWRQELNDLTMNKIFTSKDKIIDFVMEGDFLYIVQSLNNVIMLNKNSNKETQLTRPIFRNAAQIIFLNKSNNLQWRSLGGILLIVSLLLFSTQFQSLFY